MLGIFMHKSLAGLAIFIAATNVSLAARAADLPSRTIAPGFLAPAPVADWAGFYAGSVYGWGFAHVMSRQTGSSSVSLNGQTGGGLIGYNWQSGPFVYGLDGDITLHLIRGNMAAVPGLVASHVDTLYTGRARARFGYDLGDFLPFVDAGVATNEFYQANLPTLMTGSVRRATGWTAGAGLDWKVALPFLGATVLRAEYVYEAYPSTSLALYAGPVQSKLSTQFVRVALISRIGGQPARAQSAGSDQVDWSGTYGGALAGFGALRTKTMAPGSGSTSFNATGPLGGVLAGRNFTFGSWVVGFEGSSMMTNFTGHGAYPASTDNISLRNYIQADVRGRVGYAFGRLLPYFAAGFTWGRTEQRNQVTLSENGRIPSEAWTAGAGLEYMLTDRLSVRGEYLFESTYHNAQTGLTPCTACTQSLTGNMVRVGLAYYFH
jgi:outer membrane immunogenic protein